MMRASSLPAAFTVAESSVSAVGSGSAAVTRAAAESKSIEPGPIAVSSFWFFLLNPHIRFLLFFRRIEVSCQRGSALRRFELRTKIRDRGLVSRDRFVLLLDFLLQLVDAGIYFEQLFQVARFFVKGFSVRADLAFAGRAGDRSKEIRIRQRRLDRHFRIWLFSRHDV